jgi:hypothetical protein
METSFSSLRGAKRRSNLYSSNWPESGNPLKLLLSWISAFAGMTACIDLFLKTEEFSRKTEKFDEV